MLGDEFLKTYPVSEFHGTWVQDGTVIGRFSNSMVADDIYGLTENYLFNRIKHFRDHQRYCPEDTRNAAELKIKERGLEEIQSEKIRLGIPLDAPPLSLLDQAANENDRYRDKLDWAYHVLKRQIESQGAKTSATAAILPFGPNLR